MRCLYTDTTRDGNGKIISGATVSVFLAGTSTAASIYTTLTGATAVNSVTSGSDGSFEFYIDRFDYDMDQKFKLVVSKSAFTSQTYDYIEIDRVVCTTYTITAHKTITTTLRVPEGVIYDGAFTLTINAPFEAGLYKIFGSTITVSFGAGSIKEAYPEWWTTNTIPGTTDMINALNAASTCGAGRIVHTGIYAISNTYTLRSATEYVGPGGGTYLYGQEHPTAGYGACLKWIGAANGTMVTNVNGRNIKWHGIDLDGVDVANNVRGFFWDQDNTASGALSRFHMADFSVFNCGTGIQIASDAADYNCDNFTIEHFEMYMVDTGVYCKSSNTAMSRISNFKISTYHKGIWLAQAAFMSIRDGAFAGLDDANGTTDAFIVLDGATVALIEQTQGEPLPGKVNWKHIRINGSVYTPITLLSNWIDQGVVVSDNRKIISIGNYYGDDVELEATTSGVLWESHSDYYDTGIAIVDSGSNNMVHEIMPYYTGGVVSQFIDRTFFNNVVVNANRYDGGLVVGSGADRSSGTVTLTANAASTTVNNAIVTADSLIYLFPVTANAAADLGSATSVWISAKVAATSFEITHPNNANVDKTFNYLIVN